MNDKKKYYLLTFNDDYGDEHNVPALSCKTEEEYQKWRMTPSGTLNPNYEEEENTSKEYEKKWKDFWKLLEKKGYTLEGLANTSKIPKDDIKTLELEKSLRQLKRPNYHINKINSFLYASLGNSGEGFEDSYSDKYLMREFVEDGTVKVHEVDENFYRIFNETQLNSLSLCNIFDEDEFNN